MADEEIKAKIKKIKERLGELVRAMGVLTEDISKINGSLEAAVANNDAVLIEDLFSHLNLHAGEVSAIAHNAETFEGSDLVKLLNKKKQLPLAA